MHFKFFCYAPWALQESEMQGKDWAKAHCDARGVVTGVVVLRCLHVATGGPACVEARAVLQLFKETRASATPATGKKARDVAERRWWCIPLRLSLRVFPPSRPCHISYGMTPEMAMRQARGVIKTRWWCMPPGLRGCCWRVHCHRVLATALNKVLQDQRER